MKNRYTMSFGLALALAGSAALAAPILCESEDRNHMLIDDSLVSACLGAGADNPYLTGNPDNDQFLTSAAGTGYVTVSKSDGDNPFNIQYTQDGTTGTFSLDASFWDAASVGAIGFQFGTGNQPDMWFVFELVDGVTSGSWDFVNVFNRGGGLSHVNLYRVPVSEPGAIGLLGLGLLALALMRRRRMAPVASA